MDNSENSSPEALIKCLVQIILELHYGAVVKLTGDISSTARGRVRTLPFSFTFTIEGGEATRHEIAGQASASFREDALAWSLFFPRADVWTVDGSKQLEFEKVRSNDGIIRFRVVNHAGISVFGSCLDDVTML